MRCFHGFLRDESGAVTIDWVSLTAAILLLGIMVVYSIFNGGVSSLVSNINESLSSASTGANTGDAPSLNGGSGLALANGIELPIGSTVSYSGPWYTEFSTPSGGTVWSYNYSASSAPMPVGTTLTSSSTFTAPKAYGGTTYSTSSFHSDEAYSYHNTEA